MDSTWLVVSEIGGSVVLSLGESREDALDKSEAALVPRGTTRHPRSGPHAAGSGVVELDHTLRAARVIVFRRAGQGYQRPPEEDSDEEKPPARPAAYDALVPFGYDVDKEIGAGRQPPPERVGVFIEKLGIPIVMSMKVDSPPSLGSVAKSDRARKTTIAVVVVVLVVILVVVGLIFGSLK